MKRRSIFTAILFLLVLSSEIFAQSNNILEGTIKDHKTGKGIPDVNVYINSSTIGTTSNKDGIFKLEGIPDGVYEIVFTSIGYVAASKKISFRDGKMIRAKIFLEPQVYSMSEVQVTGIRPKKWQNQLKEFRAAFLGNSEFAEKCSIENPEVLDFKTDSKTGALVAYTDSTLIVVNNALGYRVRIQLVNFQWFNSTGTYKIYPFFQEMKPSSNVQLSEWKENREWAYMQSVRHFFYDLYHSKARSDGYKFNLGIERLNPEDTRYQLARRGVENISMAGFRISRSVTVHKGAVTSELVKLNNDYFFVDSYGNLLDPLSISLAGNWDQYRVGALLPFNYRPE